VEIKEFLMRTNSLFLADFETESIHLSQNPTKDVLEVQILLHNERSLSFSIWDSTGRRLKVFDGRIYNSGSTNDELKIDGLNDGLYYLKAVGGPEEWSKPFLVQR